MKSAYELAMERLEKASPSISLTADQKKEIAEIDSTYRAKIAEKEVFLERSDSQSAKRRKFDEVESLEKQHSCGNPPLAGRLRGKERKAAR